MTDSETPRRIAILGATSSIAEHTARLLIRTGARLALVARNGLHLDRIATDLELRGAVGIIKRVVDLANVDDPQDFFDSVAVELGGLDAVLIFHGLLGEQHLAERNVDELRRIIRVNFTSAAELAIIAAHRLAAAGHSRPVLLAVGSVAGDRGRASNYVYGSAKGALALVFQGLAHEYAKSRLRVVIVKAGFVDTPMTQAFQKSGPMWAKPDRIAAIIQRCLSRGGPVVYAPWFWRSIMLVIRLLPQWLMNKLQI
jgi:decaprenylphospho-beta-D-erythro-pentofuranosid-2-ulose 2-reductase